MTLADLSKNITALIKLGKLPKKFVVTEATLKEGAMTIAYGSWNSKVYMWDNHGRAHVSHGTYLGIIKDEDEMPSAGEIYLFQRVPCLDFNSL